MVNTVPDFEQPLGDSGRTELTEPSGGCGNRASPLDPLGWSELMASAQGGDQAAYARLLRGVIPYLRSMARRHYRAQSGTGVDTEEVVQDILLTLHAIRDSYDPARPFGPWLVAIARRRLIDQVRKRSRISAHELAVASIDETFASVEANVEEAEWDRQSLHRAIAALPVRQRKAVTVLKLRELSLKEAALETGLSVAALKAALHRAIKTLRATLDRSENKT